MNYLSRQLPNTLARTDKYGRVLIGGPIGVRDITSQPFPGAEFIADVLPGSAQQRSIGRLQDQYQAYQQAERPITKALRAADMALEGSGLAADLFPAIKAGAATASFMLPLMARHNDSMAGLARALRKQQGIIGYHGSPHKFDKFDHAMMGSGEGAQAYGWGTYLADSPGVARSYQSPGSPFVNTAPRPYYTLDGEKATGYGISMVGEHGGVDEAIAAHKQTLSDQVAKDWDFYYREKIDSLQPFRESAADPKLFDERVEALARKEADERVADMRAAIDDVAEIEQWRGRNIEKIYPGNLYEVDLPDDQIANMLDWDAPLSEQPEAVKAAIKANPPQSVKGPYSWDEIKDWPGQEYYNRKSLESGQNQQSVSEGLNRLGIPGIKYWDGGSRGVATGNATIYPQRIKTLEDAIENLANTGDEMADAFAQIQRAELEEQLNSLKAEYAQALEGRTRNYVVFDENLMTILKRNDEVLK